MRRILVAFLLLSAPCVALACISLPPNPQQAARGTVLVGYVTGESYPDWEASLIKNGPTKYSLFGRRVIRVTFTQAIAGELIGSLEIETPCYSSEPKLGERAIVVRVSGSDYVVPGTKDYETAIQSAVEARHGR